MLSIKCSGLDLIKSGTVVRRLKMSYDLVVDGVETKVTINDETLKFESKDNGDGKYLSVYLEFSSSLAECEFCSFRDFSKT